MSSSDACRVLAAKLGLDPALVIESWSERAAIREFDGGQPRDVAEREAFDDTCAMFDVSLTGERLGPRSAAPATIAATKSSRG